MIKCAILGGLPVRKESIPWSNTMGDEELNAVISVMKSGNLSSFLATSGDMFYGGPKVREFEESVCCKFKTQHAVSFNSASTALQAAVFSCGVGPGDEVIVSPYTMTASASAVLLQGAVPIFADVEIDTYNIDPCSIEDKISPHTKAIMTVNIFGLPSNIIKINYIAQKYNLKVIVDNSQSPGATINGVEAGTLGDVGVYSFNYHKIIHSGEGGVLVTSDENIAKKAQLMRNHGELTLDEIDDMSSIAIGSNYRMSELHAAIGIEQLKKLDRFLEKRRYLANIISNEIDKREGLSGVFIPEGYTHSYYVYPIKFYADKWGFSREIFVKALTEEGFPVRGGYVKPIYLMNLYKHKHVFNNTTFPFSYIDKPTQNYTFGICPTVEELQNNTLIMADICRIPYEEEDIKDFFVAIDKIWNQRQEIAKLVS